MVNLKTMVDTKALMAGAIAGAAGTLASRVPALGRYAPAVGLAVGSAFAGDASTKKMGQFLAGISATAAALGGTQNAGGFL